MYFSGTDEAAKGDRIQPRVGSDKGSQISPTRFWDPYPAAWPVQVCA